MQDLMTKAAADVLAERRRQTEVEGWTPEHDDTHTLGEMACAAAAYAGYSAARADGCLTVASRAFDMWPWRSGWWKPTTPRRDLVKAGALILAEIERLDRAEAAPHPQALTAARNKNGAEPGGWRRFAWAARRQP